RRRGAIDERDAGITAKTPRVRAFSDADTQHVTRDLEVLDRLRQGEAVGRDETRVGLDVHERRGVEVLRIDHGAMHVREDLEVPPDANVVAVAGHAVGDLARTRRSVRAWFDFHQFFDLPIRENAHPDSLLYGAGASHALYFSLGSGNLSNPALLVKVE